MIIWVLPAGSYWPHKFAILQLYKTKMILDYYKACMEVSLISWYGEGHKLVVFLVLVWIDWWQIAIFKRGELEPTSSPTSTTVHNMPNARSKIKKTYSYKFCPISQLCGGKERTETKLILKGNTILYFIYSNYILYVRTFSGKNKNRETE